MPIAQLLQLATASIIIQIYKKTIKNKFLEHKSTKLISFQLKLHAGFDFDYDSGVQQQL